MLTREKLRHLRKAKFDGPNKLRLAMELHDETQTELAAALGLAQSQISEDANGKYSEMSLDKARAYARHFGCTTDDLFAAQEAVAS